MDMNIAFIGPGIMPIPPTGWGAVEMMIWDYATILGNLNHTGVIINTPDKDQIIRELKEEEFDIVHLHYDVFHDIIPRVLDTIKGKLIVSSHYPYINHREMWMRDNYAPTMESYAKNKDFHIFASSQTDINTFIMNGAIEEKCWLSRLGVLHSSYEFESFPSYEKTLCFSQICDRKRQYIIQNFDNVDFIGRMEPGRFCNSKNYRGEYDRKKLNEEITKYPNFVLLSLIENTTPLAVKEALICGLGLVVSQSVSAELDVTKEFIDVIPEEKMDDILYINSVLIKNKEYSIAHREEIRKYGINTFGLESILENEYVPKLQSIIDEN
jgi:hypothetical protein